MPPTRISSTRLLPWVIVLNLAAAMLLVVALVVVVTR
jgi:hypothetical protein